jgi:hypothetical protein
MEKSGGDIPLVAYGRDQPNSFAMLSPDNDQAQDLAALRAEALANLAKVEVSVEKVELDALTFWAAHAVVAPEKTLAFMALARGAYERNEGGRQLSPTIFLVMDGSVSGIATAAEPEPKKKGFFSQLFN